MASGIIIALLALGAAAEPQRPAAPTDMERAIQEFRLETARMGARADSPKSQKSSSATRSQWHGRVYENLRNDLFDAVPHEIRQRGAEKSLLRRNQFGFSVSGPVAIPRLLKPLSSTFFSLSYEGVRERISRTSLRTIALPEERSGDFSRTVDQSGDRLDIFDPASTRPNPAFNATQPVSTANLQYARDPFPDNRIPLSRLNRTAVSALSLYPQPNASAGPFFQNNYFINSPETNTANGVIGKLDHTINERHRVSFDFNYSNGLLGASKYFPTTANPGPSDTHSSTRRASIDWTLTASPQTINTVGGEVDSNRYNTGDRSEAVPVYTFDEYIGMGRTSPFTTNARHLFVLTDGLSLRKGKHSLRLSARLTWEQVNSFWPRSPASLYHFGVGLTSLPGIVNTGHSFASYLLGLPGQAERSTTIAPSYFRRSSVVLTARDQYEVRPNLNVSFAVAAIRRTPRVEKYNRQSTIDLAAINPANGRPGTLVFAGVGGTARGLRPNAYRLDPSASMSWSPRLKAKTTLRASAALTHTPTPIYFGQWGTQGFNTYQTFVSPNVQLQPAADFGSPLPAPAHPAPDLRPEAANDTVADLVDQTDRDSVYYSGGASLEREFPGALVVTAGLGISGGHNLLISNGSTNLNPLPIQALAYRDRLNDEAFSRSLRPYPQYKGFNLYSMYPWGKYRRVAASLRAEKRVTHGLTFNLYGELSKQMDDYSGPYGAQDYFNRRNEWSLTPYSRPQYLQWSYTYELPLGLNQPLMNFQDWRHYLVDGWSVSGSGGYYSGVPLALRPSFNNTGGVFDSLRVNVVPGVSPTVSQPGPELWFNPAAFDQPADFTMGDASRTHPNLRGPTVQSWDLNLNKRVPLDAERVLEFSMAAFNLLNHADWNSPDTTIGPASAPNVNAGKIIGSHGGRVIQMGLRISF